MEKQSSAVRNALFGFGLLIALFIAGAAWTLQPTTAATVASVPSESASRETLTGRVISVGASGQFVTIATTPGSTDLDAITVGDPVEVLRSSPSSTAGAKSELSSRLLGVWLIAVAGTVVAFRPRRSLTI